MNKMEKFGIFLGDLAVTVDEEELERIFSEFGTILDIRISRDKRTNKSLSYGFIDFATAKGAMEAMNHMNGFPCKGRPIRLGWANNSMAKKMSERKLLDPSSSEPISISVTFRSLYKTRTVSDDFLGAVFSSFGPVVSVTIHQIDMKDGCSGTATVMYSQDIYGTASAVRGSTELKNAVVEGVHLKCQFSHMLDWKLLRMVQKAGARTQQQQQMYPQAEPPQAQEDMYAHFSSRELYSHPTSPRDTYPQCQAPLVSSSMSSSSHSISVGSYSSNSPPGLYEQQMHPPAAHPGFPDYALPPNPFYQDCMPAYAGGPYPNAPHPHMGLPGNGSRF